MSFGGLVEFFRTHWPPIEYTPVAGDVALAEIGPDTAWWLEQDGPKAFLAYCTTLRGQQELARLYQRKGAA